MQVQAQPTEHPRALPRARTERRRATTLVTLGKPFADAIDEWLRQQNLSAGGKLNNQRCHPNFDACSIAGLRQLADMAGLSVERLREVRYGRQKFITIDRADRIAWALDIPLPLLAEEFVPLAVAERKWR